ncbi:cysteine-rich receptor-like protein kinase 15 [Rutidosis leptorrhynchoides]|uniref:cysteine-rich receptor-like protein kinase 15 n=1 Tax=Rutidosis leptorrhynchoides TaxID=125765 RepID=UPI003A9A1FF2
MDFLFFSLFFPVIIGNIYVTTGQTNLWAYYCGKTGNYTTDSNYKQDLDQVLSSSFLKTNNGFGFFNSSFGEVKAAAVCRGDLDPDTCRECVDDAKSRVRQECPNQWEAVGWYHTCFLRYSYQTMDNYDGFYARLPNNIPDTIFDLWNQTVVTLLDTLRMEAARGGPLRKYASKNVTISDSYTIYGTMQCTPDFSETECDECLVNATSLVRWYPRSLGVRFYTPNCIIRYETDKFFNSTWFPQILVPPLHAPPPLLAPLPPLLAPSPTSPPGNMKRTNTVVIVIPALLVLAVIILVVFITFRRRQKLKQPAGPFVPEFQVGFGDNSFEGSKHDSEDDNTGEMNSFDLSKILAATNNFSLDNKLGEGGFGPVYKGILEDGKEIAVKRLSCNSGQGLVEFKNEVKLIIKLQHKNLVRLLGYCVKGLERILIYEFLVNNSLDTFLFDPNKSKELDWPKRANIVIGIAKGLRYLHEDSRLKIIHRDLKTGNILLDDEMNPKISDFGTARIFKGKQMEATTMRIIGTYGYMAPEYAMEGLFSAKSDVYSFGVLMLEIISGQRNNKFIYNDKPRNFVTTAWHLWNENNGEELIDRFLIQECPVNDIVRWINIALLCVQEDPQDRPTMSAVVFMLEGQWSTELPRPSEPPTSYAIFKASEQTTSSSTATGDVSEHLSVHLAISTSSSC